MATERRRVCFAGRVQNVGFRMTTRRVARSFPVTGYVLNLPDGRVEVVVEGEPAVIDAFLSAVRAEMESFIRSESSDRVPTGDPPFGDFSIRF
jgi:acylphosphatase